MTVTIRRAPVRRALSVAVRYKPLGRIDQELVLEGTHHDPRVLRKLLIDLFGYREQDIRILMDDDSGQHMCPTKKNIIKSMHELVADAQPGDHFVFHFSGHGSQVRNLDGTEKDGMDEVIWPFDIQYRSDEDCDNYIIDDLIHDILVKHIPAGAHFMMVFDCCHSGTAADLPYTSDECESLASPVSMYKPQFDRLKSIRLAGTDHEASRLGQHKSIRDKVHVPHTVDVTSWSACEDDQVTYGDKKHGGLFVYALNKALRANPTATHAEVFHSVRHIIKNIVAGINRRRPERHYAIPSPELCAEEELDSIADAPVIDNV
ncbi:uncharacterized protein LAESUDRAFT_296402 [Laetiporus sulphureus 93-53]|uniref:Peptidase C14 caspase domain-containing protein n=1 Tax=Laetiporus sulphureus 93-53 TaxID=1314785 RepID=A0A165DB75_9APHY|nr:uncharacterized protein LAESUDRAFT_296402 [Laetiporus sulphureus 93-53]KZT04471.1 hypothetical protein LAESUDRAFT_296402 [Laetiporus sulphureus 93-53]